MSRRLRWFVAAAAVAAAGLSLVRVCSYAPGMGAATRECTCRGKEWVLYDRTAADGPRKTLCVGIVTSRRCRAYEGGPVIPCNPPRR